MGISLIVFIGQQNATVRQTQRARDHLPPTEETRSVQLEVYTCVNTQQAHRQAFWSTIQNIMCPIMCLRKCSPTLYLAPRGRPGCHYRVLRQEAAKEQVCAV